MTREGENVQGTRKASPSLVELARRVHRGEITPEEAAQIFARTEASRAKDESA